MSNLNYLINWIQSNTAGVQSVVDFGAGRFDKLNYVHSDVERKMGIEIWLDYFSEPPAPGCRRKQGDMRNYRILVDDDDMDCALFVDSLEHLRRRDAVYLIYNIQQDFNKILLMIPEGNHPQKGATKYQKHLSSWSFLDIKNLGFQEINLQPKFHAVEGKDQGCIFAIWEKEDESKR